MRGSRNVLAGIDGVFRPVGVCVMAPLVEQVGALERAYYEIAAVFAGCDGACGDSLASMTPAMTAQAPMEAHTLARPPPNAKRPPARLGESALASRPMPTMKPVPVART